MVQKHSYNHICRNPLWEGDYSKPHHLHIHSWLAIYLHQQQVSTLRSVKKDIIQPLFKHSAPRSAVKNCFLHCGSSMFHIKNLFCVRMSQRDVYKSICQEIRQMMHSFLFPTDSIINVQHRNTFHMTDTPSSQEMFSSSLPLLKFGYCKAYNLHFSV
jgi:hypothetical protein